MNEQHDDSARPGTLAFIRIPESMAVRIGSFTVDPAIPVPVELGPSGADLSGLSWEMIVAGMLRLLAAEPDAAHAVYYRDFVLAAKPGIFEELSETGILKARNGDYPVAEEIFKALSGLSPEAPEPMLNLAVLYEDSADALERAGKDELSEAVRDKAFAVYKRLLAMEPPFPDAFFNAGFFFLKARSFDRAGELFETFAGLSDDQAKVAKAREIVARLRTRSDADSSFRAAYDAIKMGREEEGVALALEFSAANPGVWNGWFLVGWGRRRLGRWAEGREAFLKALELGAEETDLLNELSICEMELGLLKESRGHLEAALRREPENVKIISNLGVVARRMGRADEAAGFFRAVLELEPGDRLALAQLEELGAAGA